VVTPSVKTSPGLWVCVVVMAEASLAVGSVQAAAWLPSRLMSETVRSDGQLETTGAVRSVVPVATVTVKAQIAVLLEASEKAYTTWVVPSWKVLPEDDVWETDTVETKSTAEGSVQETAVLDTPDATNTVMSLGQLLMTGAVLSVTVVVKVMVNEQMATFPEASEKV